MRDMKTTQSSIHASYNDVIRDRRYFGTADTAGASVWTTDEIRLFEDGQGQIVKNVTTGSDVTQRDCDTSLFTNNGIIPNAQTFTVMAIGIDIHLANVQPKVPFEDDTIQQIDVNPVQVVNPYPLVEYLRSQGVFSLYRNSTEFLEQNNVADYPSGSYNSGWGSDGSAVVPSSGAGSPEDGIGAYNVNGFIVAQNGMAFRPLTVWHQLASLDQFHGRFAVQRPALLTGTGLVGYIDFLLLGQCDLDRKSVQLVQHFGMS